MYSNDFKIPKLIELYNGMSPIDIHKLNLSINDTMQLIDKLHYMQLNGTYDEYFSVK